MNKAKDWTTSRQFHCSILNCNNLAIIGVVLGLDHKCDKAECIYNNLTITIPCETNEPLIPCCETHVSRISPNDLFGLDIPIERINNFFNVEAHGSNVRKKYAFRRTEFLFPSMN